MKIDFNQINGHRQLTSISCIPMSIETVLKLLGLMSINDFSIQQDISKSQNNEWIRSGFTYPTVDPKIKFSQQFLLTALPEIKADRGVHFMKDYFEDLFITIDEELLNNRLVIISLQSGIQMWHMEIIYNKINDFNYETLTYYYNENQMRIFPTKNLRKIVTEMQGTDIFTYTLL